MSPVIRRLLRWFPVLVGLSLGIGLFFLLIVNRQSPVHEDTFAAPPTVTVIAVESLPFRLEADGHGVVRPARSWQAVANVPGRVVYRHPELASGNFIVAGTRLLELDPSRYRMAIAEAEAELAKLAAEQASLQTELQNTRRLVELERQRLQLAERELTRIERLAESGDISPSQRDEQRRATLAQRQAVQSLDNQLSLFPSRREQLAAQREQASTRLAQAQRDLEDTRFVAPYDLRLGQVEVELHQHVAAGQPLFQAEDVAAAEVEARVPFTRLRRLAFGLVAGDRLAGQLPMEQLDLAQVQAEVFPVGVDDVVWPARVTRAAGGLDPTTRAARVVVTVEEPYRAAEVPQRPPLQPDTYVRVRLSLDAPEPLLVVPAAAVHDGEVYRVVEGDRLQRQRVEVGFEQRDLAVIVGGLAAGDRVIVDDVAPAVEGMRVQPRSGERLEQQLRRSAAGEAR